MDARLRKNFRRNGTLRPGLAMGRAAARCGPIQDTNRKGADPLHPPYIVPVTSIQASTGAIPITPEIVIHMNTALHARLTVPGADRSKARSNRSRARSMLSAGRCGVERRHLCPA